MSIFQPILDLDQYLFYLINQLTLSWEWLDIFGIFCAQYLGYFIWSILLILLVLKFKNYWKVIFEAVATAVVSRFLITGTIRLIMPRLRPFNDPTAKILVDKMSESSFPSGHASFYFALSTIIYLYNKKLGILFYILSVFIVAGRVFVGIHWPSDILAGIVVALFSSWLVHKLFKKFIIK